MSAPFFEQWGSEFDPTDNLQGAGDISGPVGIVDETLSILGDEETLRNFMKTQDEINAAYDDTDNPVVRQQLSQQASRLLNSYPRLHSEALRVRNAVRLGETTLSA